MDAQPPDPKEKAPPKAGGPLLVIAEDVLSRVSAREDLLGGEESAGDVDAELDLTIDIAASEIARALVETGRSLRYLHLLRVSFDARASRRGYVEGARATGTVCNALARDLTDEGSETATPPAKF
ncbi:MAG: hypothetical protein ACYTDU_10305 [Planctomycetota bacterium]|jgi:hypothetical protein